MALVGYARVSTVDQNTALQLDALKQAGCATIFADQGKSGRTFDRPELVKCLAGLAAGDVLVVWKLDRLGRSLSHLIATTADLQARGIGFRSLSESIDTTSPTGKLIFHVLGALAEFERGLIAERTRAGLASAKRRGIRPGPKGKLTPLQLADARKRIDNGDALRHVARILRVAPSTLYRSFQRQGI
jgi:DNA invertase Pin-like site-specific DNA recombinase